MKWTEHPNYKRWLFPPTIEQIEAVIKMSGVSESKFEAYYGIFPGLIRRIRYSGNRLPVQYWHLFLEDTKQQPVINKVIKLPKTTHIRKTTNIKKNSRLAQLT